MTIPRLLTLACLLCLPATTVLAQPAEPPARADAPQMLRSDVLALVERLAERMNREFIFNPQDLYTLSAHSTAGADADYDTLLGLLRESGYVAIEGDDQIRIVPAARMRSEPIPLVQEDQRGISDHQVVTRIIAVEGVPAAQLVPILRPMMPQYAQLGAAQGTNGLVVVDFYDNVRRMTEIVRQIEATATGD